MTTLKEKLAMAERQEKIDKASWGHIVQVKDEIIMALLGSEALPETSCPRMLFNRIREKHEIPALPLRMNTKGKRVVLSFGQYVEELPYISNANELLHEVPYFVERAICSDTTKNEVIERNLTASMIEQVFQANDVIVDVKVKAFGYLVRDARGAKYIPDSKVPALLESARGGE